VEATVTPDLFAIGVGVLLLVVLGYVQGHETGMRRMLARFEEQYQQGLDFAAAIRRDRARLTRD
jgi:hypothetical protein